MSDKKSVEPTPKNVLRAERQRLAQEEGARAMADVQRRAIAVRQNMQRLRALREARETAEIRRSLPLPQAVKKKRQKRSVRLG